MDREKIVSTCVHDKAATEPKSFLVWLSNTTNIFGGSGSTNDDRLPFDIQTYKIENKHNQSEKNKSQKKNHADWTCMYAQMKIKWSL